MNYLNYGNLVPIEERRQSRVEHKLGRLLNCDINTVKQRYRWHVRVSGKKVNPIVLFGMVVKCLTPLIRDFIVGDRGDCCTTANAK